MTDSHDPRRFEESARRYEMLAQHSRDIVLYMRRADGRLLEVNAAAIAAYGYTREELLARTIHDLRAVTTHADVAQQMRVANTRGILFETTHRRKDGSLFPVEVSSQGATIDGTETLISIVRDITERRRAELALRASEEKFSKAFATNPAAIVLTTLETGQIIEVNDTWVEMFGYERDEVIGRLSLSLNVWPSPEERVRWAEDLQAKGAFRNREQVLIKRSGEKIVALGSAETLRIGGDSMVLSTWLDISDLKRAELALRGSEQLSRSVFDHAATGIAIVDWSGRFRTCNPAYCRLLGYQEEELRQMQFSSLLHPADAEENLRLSRRLKSGEISSFENDSRYVRKDGEDVWVHKFVCVLPELSGERSVMVLVTDITERRRSEEQLRLASARFETALTASPVVVFNQDCELRYTWIHNPFAGRQPSEVLGRQEADVFARAEDAARFSALKRQVLASGVSQRRELPAWVEGAERTYDITVQPQRDAANQIIGVTCAAVDITDQKRVEQELSAAQRSAEAASRAKDHFLAVLSHELRTPLSPVLATAQMLEADQSLSSGHREMIRMIRRNVELEARLIDDLLDLTRISRNKLELHLGTVDVHEKLRHVLRMCDDESGAKGLAIAADFGAQLHHVRADPARLQQIIWNVVKNAVKFTPAPGRVEIATSNPHPQRIAITVRDTGIGIPPEMLPRIFDAFEQGGRDITRQFGGLGLGLAISKTLVDAHGGSLRAESAGLGHGATFTIEFALTKGEADPAASRETKRHERLSCHVLLVEDHADTLRVMTRLLARFGCTVVPASSMSEALRHADAQPFDLLVSDIGLPDGSGIELIQQINARRPVKGIALSGYGMDEDIAKSKAAGFAAHLRKPVNLGLLEETLRRLMAE